MDSVVSESDASSISSKGILFIKPQIIEKNIPEDVELKYDYKSIKKAFGKKGAVLRSLDFSDPKKFVNYENLIPILEKSITRLEDAVNVVLGNINKKNGKCTTLHSKVSAKDFKRLNESEIYKNYIKWYKDIISDSPSDLDLFLYFFQIRYVYEQNKESFIKKINRSKYEIRKIKLESDSEVLKSGWKSYSLEEKDGCLSAIFPLSDEISCGQRDVMILRVLFDYFKNNIDDSKINLLFIDDVFEYLDESNKLVAEYYIKQLIDIKNTELYVILLSHQSKENFRSYIFKEKFLSFSYLINSQPIPTKDMKGLICFREKLSNERKTDSSKDELYKKISRLLFHYSPENEDLSALCSSYIGSFPGLKKSMLDKSSLFQFLIDEVNKYFTNTSSYDPYAVCTALRIREERNIYEKLDNSLKNDFVNTYETNKKILYCEEKGIIVPDTYAIITSIHNEADHAADKDGEFKEKTLVYSLKNQIIRNIVMKIFNYSETPLCVSDLL